MELFFDWYIEFSKPLLNSKDKNLIFETKNILNHVQKRKFTSSAFIYSFCN